MFCSGRKPGLYKIQGIGTGIDPEVLDMAVVDGVTPVHSHEAVKMTRLLQKEEAVLVGYPSGRAAVTGTLKVSTLCVLLTLLFAFLLTLSLVLNTIHVHLSLEDQ